MTISTELKGFNPVQGFVAKMVLQRVYREELDLLADVAEEPTLFAQLSMDKNGKA